MSMPKYPEFPEMSRECAINQIISSIAYEELALSHIINAEGEKLQFVLGTLPDSKSSCEPVTIEDLLKINKSITMTLESVAKFEDTLKSKLNMILNECN